MAVILSMLAITLIVGIARYYGSPKLGLNLALALALSVIVGIAIQKKLQDSDNKKKVEIVNTSIQPIANNCYAISLDSLVNIPVESEHTMYGVYNNFFLKTLDAQNNKYNLLNRIINTQSIDSS